MKLKALKSRLFSQPLLINPRHFVQFIDSLEEIPLVEDEIEAEDPAKQRAKHSQGPRYWQLRDDGIAVIPIDAPLMNKTSIWEEAGFCKSYESIAQNFKEAHDHQDTKGVVFQYGTGGGEAAGTQDLAEFIYSYKSKPVWSFVDDSALSAGQWLASTGDRTVVTPSAEMGSVGVWSAHTDMSKYMEDMGIDITLVSSGEHKVDGHPYAPLPESVKNKMQQDIDVLRDKFAGAVGEFLDIPKLRVLETEAQIYSGQEAVDIGFAHETLKAHEFYDAFSEHINGNGASSASRSRGAAALTESDMTQEKGGDDQKAADEIKNARIEAFEEGKKEGLKVGRQEGLEIASKTYAAVLGHEEAKGKSQGAIKLLSKGLNAEDVVDLLPTVAKDEVEVEDVSKEQAKKILVDAQKQESEEVINHSDNVDADFDNSNKDEKATVTSISGLSKMFDDVAKRGIRHG